jgi:hypothetical protein
MTHSPHSTESHRPPTGLDCRVSIDVPPRCSEARLLRIIGAAIDAFEKLSGKRRRQWPMATQIEPTSKVRTPRKPTLATLIKRAEKTGRQVTSITTPDGTTLHFGEPEPAAPENSWPLDEFRTKETKQ